MSYTDKTADFFHKKRLDWQDFDELAENDEFLRQIYAAYKRPVLQFVSVTQVDVEANTGTANETKIVFPDGETRNVVEDTATTNKYRRFDITAAAQFSSGTEDSGLRSGLSEATNTWYAIYAVKSTLDATKFVLAGDTTLPLQANFSTLNGRYGANGWYYLGMIRNGDNNSATGDILAFTQVGNRTYFRNGSTRPGIKFVSTATTGDVSYTTTNGTGTTDIPNHATLATWNLASAVVGSGSNLSVKNQGGNRIYWRFNGDVAQELQIDIPASEGVNLVQSGGGTVQRDIYFSGWVDNVLGVSYNPYL